MKAKSLPEYDLKQSLDANYLLKWRFRVNSDVSTYSSYLAHYLPKWSLFMREVLSKENRLNFSQISDLPEMRRIVSSKISVSDIVEEVTKLNSNLARSLIDTSTIFDISPLDLKVYVLQVFGINSKNYCKLFPDLVNSSDKVDDSE